MERERGMAMHFTVLASGSSGNASLLQVDGFGVLIDAGLGPRQLAGRLADIGACWQSIQVVLLTHTHGDHWNERTFGHLLKRRLPLFCHEAHFASLGYESSVFRELRAE